MGRQETYADRVKSVSDRVTSEREQVEGAPLAQALRTCVKNLRGGFKDHPEVREWILALRHLNTPNDGTELYAAAVEVALRKLPAEQQAAIFALAAELKGADDANLPA